MYANDVTRSIGKGYITNLNEHGMGVVTPHHLEIGQKLLLLFTLPNGWKFDFFGKVIHTQDGVESRAYGIEFAPGQGTFVLKIV
jgi:Tfp pilus assembly protein PilZ